MKDNIKFNDPITPDQVSEVLYKADIGIIPKRGRGFAGEAFSTKLLEFLAAGLPTVASSTEIDRYYFKDDSIITFFADEDSVDCADKIMALYNNKSLQKSCAKKGLEYISENNWPLKSKMYEKIINEIRKA